MSKHVSVVDSICFFQLRRRRQTTNQTSRRSWSPSTAGLCVRALATRLLQLCSGRSSSVHYWVTSESTQRRRTTCRLENIWLCNTGVEAATLVVRRTPYQNYKLCLLTHLVHIHKASQYLTDIVTTVAESTAPQPCLRSADTAAYARPRTRTRFGERGFCFVGPVFWNSLPSHLHSMTDTIVFKRIGLYSKPNFFRQAFDHWQFLSALLVDCIYIYSGALEIYYVFVSKSYTKF